MRLRQKATKSKGLSKKRSFRANLVHNITTKKLNYLTSQSFSSFNKTQRLKTNHTLSSFQKKSFTPKYNQFIQQFIKFSSGGLFKKNKGIYAKSWGSLLSKNEVKVNFVDGKESDNNNFQYQNNKNLNIFSKKYKNNISTPLLKNNFVQNNNTPFKNNSFQKQNHSFNEIKGKNIHCCLLLSNLKTKIPFFEQKTSHIKKRSFFSSKNNQNNEESINPSTIYHRIPEWREKQRIKNPLFLIFQNSTFKHVLKTGYLPDEISNNFHVKLFSFYHGIRLLFICIIVGTFLMSFWFIFGEPASERASKSEVWSSFKDKILNNHMLELLTKFLLVGAIIFGGITCGFSAIGLAGLGTLTGVSASIFLFILNTSVESGLNLNQFFFEIWDWVALFFSQIRESILPFIISNRNPSVYECMTEEETDKLAHELSVEKARMEASLEMFDLIEYVPLSGGCEQWRALSVQMFGHENNADMIRNEIIDWIRLNPTYEYKGIPLQDHSQWIVFMKEYGNLDDPPPPYLQKVFEGMQEQFEEEYWDLQDALKLSPETINQLRIGNEEVGRRPLHRALWFYDYLTEGRHPVQGGDLMWTFFPVQDYETGGMRLISTKLKGLSWIQRWRRVDPRRRMNYSLFYPHIPREDPERIRGSFADVDLNSTSSLSGAIWPLFTSGFVRKETDTPTFIREKLLSIMRHEWDMIYGESYRREDELRGHMEWLNLLESNPNDAVVLESTLEKLHPNLPELRGNDVTLLAAAEAFRSRIAVLTSRPNGPNSSTPIRIIEPKPQLEKVDEWAGFHLEKERYKPYVNTLYLSHHEKADIWRSVHKPPLSLEKWEDEKLYWRSQGRPIPSRESALFQKWNRPSHLRSPGYRETVPYQKYDSSWLNLFYSMMIAGGL